MDIPASDARRLLLVALAGATAIVATAIYQVALGPLGGWLTWALVSLFALLTAGLALGFWTATAGFLSLLWRGRGRRDADGEPVDGPVAVDTALVMPIYNEDAAAICAGLHAMLADLDATGHGERFHIYILSDSTDPDRWVREVAAWDELVRAVNGQDRVFYRHRAENHERKTGNIADFLTRWGTRYEYAVVLDADSIMAGASLVALRERLRRRPQTALIQTDPRPIERRSLWARMQQFAAGLYGPVGARGLRLWAQDQGTCFGHNMILRVRPFIDHCGLGHLPGRAPLGGAVLSHDFVEAALLVRAGWKVEFHDDLGGSWEECPTTLLDFAKRDRRWCQGNLQHAWVLFQPGLHWVSRMHLFLGIMAYAGSPLWVLFLILSLAHATWVAGPAGGPKALQLGLFAAIVGVLLVPKLYGVLAGMVSRRARRAHGGLAGIAASAVAESVLAALTAPLMMLYHTRFVIETLTGFQVQWTAQARGEQSAAWRELVHEHAQHVLAGGLLALAAWTWAPGLLWWLAPVWLPLLLAVPIAAVLGSVGAGTLLGRLGLLRIATEADPPPVITAKRALVAQGRYAMPGLDGADALARAIADPLLNRLHAQVQEATQEAPYHADRDLVERVAAAGPEGLDRTQRKALLRDPEAMRRLHVVAWSAWPRPRLEAALGRSVTG